MSDPITAFTKQAAIDDEGAIARAERHLNMLDGSDEIHVGSSINISCNPARDIYKRCSINTHQSYNAIDSTLESTPEHLHKRFFDLLQPLSSDSYGTNPAKTRDALFGRLLFFNEFKKRRYHAADMAHEPYPKFMTGSFAELAEYQARLEQSIRIYIAGSDLDKTAVRAEYDRLWAPIREMNQQIEERTRMSVPTDLRDEMGLLLKEIARIDFADQSPEGIERLRSLSMAIEQWDDLRQARAIVLLEAFAPNAAVHVYSQIRASSWEIVDELGAARFSWTDHVPNNARTLALAKFFLLGSPMNSDGELRIVGEHENGWLRIEGAFKNASDRFPPVIDARLDVLKTQSFLQSLSKELGVTDLLRQRF